MLHVDLPVAPAANYAALLQISPVLLVGMSQKTPWARICRQCSFIKFHANALHDAVFYRIHCKRFDLVGRQ